MTERVPYSGQIYSRRNYFDDGVRKIDFVLVANVVKTADELDTLIYFLSELLRVGIQYEISMGKNTPDYLFIKLHCTKKTLDEYADVHFFVFDYRNPRILSRRNRFFPCGIFHNVTTRKDTNHPAFNRAYGSLSSNKTRRITSWERSLITYKILQRTKFSDKNYDEGVNLLIARGFLKDAYPIHDGSNEWKTSGPLTDCQLLYRYWANLKATFKHQPLPLIYKYYGPEVAFYFAYAEFYSKMLVVPAILGVMLLIYNWITRDYWDTERMTDICTNTHKLCTLCFNERGCKFTPIKNFCPGAHIVKTFDNLGGGIFAFFMGFWSIIYLERWRRQEYILRYRWNLMNLESDSSYRLEFLKTNNYTRISSISGELEYYIPIKIKVLNSIRTICGLSLIISIVIIVILLNNIYRVQITKLINASDMDTIKAHLALFIMTTSAVITTIVITFLGPYFNRIAIYLADQENPQTYVNYYNSCIYKVYATSFANGYFSFFYVAFIKGIFFTHPGDEDVYDRLGLRSDLCNINGCSYTLTISILFFMVLKNSLHRLYRTLKPIIKEHVQGHIADKQSLPPWELGFYLSPCKDMFMVREFMDVIMQYGYVLFFIASLQLTPILSLMTNIINLRVDAINIMKNYRRPVVKQLPGIGPWNNILSIVTYIGTASNALVIAFTSDIWQREIYRYFNGNLAGYVNSTLSEFSIDDYHQNVSKILEASGQNMEVCVYRGARYPYYHEDKYQWTEDHWHLLMYKLGFVVIYEQLLWLIISMVSTFRECIPSIIKKKMISTKFKQKAGRYEVLNAEPEHSRLSSEINLDEILELPEESNRFENVYREPIVDTNYYLPEFFVTKRNLYY